VTSKTLALILLAFPLRLCPQPIAIGAVLKGALEHDPVLEMDRLVFEQQMSEAEQKDRESRVKLSLRNVGGRASTSAFGDRREALGTATLELAPALGQKVTVDARQSFSYTTSTTSSASPVTSDKTMYALDPQLAVTMKQSIVNGGLPSRSLVDAARSHPAAIRTTAAATLQDAVNGAILRAARLFFSVAENRQRVAIAQAQVEARRVEADNIQKGAPLRLGGPAEARRARLVVREAEIDLAEARTVLARMESDLERAVGRDAGELDSTIPSVHITLDGDALARKAVTESRKVKVADAELRRKQAEAADAAIKDAPTVNVGLTLDGDYYTTDTVERTLPDSWYLMRPKIMLSVLVDLPLGRGRDRDLVRGVAAAGAMKARMYLSQAAEGVAAEIADKFAERGRLAAVVELRAERAAIADEDLRVQTDLLAARQATPADVAAARLEVEDRGLASWRARADLCLLDLEIAAAAGDDLRLLFGL
jgi:outer membrane protein TolC